MRSFALAATILALAAAPATADTITYNGRGLGVTGFTAQFDNGTDSKVYTKWAGELRLTGLGGSAEEVRGYCLDFLTTLNSQQSMTVHPITAYPDGDGGSAPANVLPYSGFVVGELLERYARRVETDAQGGALQFAIWEAIYDGVGGDLNTGNFRLIDAPASAPNLASDVAAILASINGRVSPDGIWLDGQAANSRIQDYAVPTPEPVSLLLFGTGVTALAVVLRRRRHGN